MNTLKSYFLNETTLKTETMAGVTTFLTMVYIAFVNPVILHDAGMDKGAVFTATCLVTAFGCAFTGLIANLPVAIAPGMALNVYFSYSVVQGLGLDWPHALALVFISGVLFFIVTLTPLKRLLVDALPYNLQIAILIGISLLIALIALQNNHIIVDDVHSLMKLGDIKNAQTGLFFLGFLFILVLDYYQIKGALILGIVSITLLSLLLGFSSWEGLMALPPSINPTFLQLDFSGFLNAASLKATFTFFLIAVFDATGTLVGLLNPSLFKREKDFSGRLSRCLTVDAAASSLAGLLGSASTSPYIESATGINAGGRSGLTPLVVALGFILTLFFYPLAKIIPVFAVGPALLYVACCMMRHVTEIKFTDICETAACTLIIILIPFTSSIANGIGGGIIAYTLLKLFTRQKVSAPTLCLSLTFLLFFLIN